MNQIAQKLKNLPGLPGVYIMKDSLGNVIYVGKSKCLKNRVRQYFHSSNHTAKVAAMVDNIDDFEYIVTDTEMEALVLECNLIKKYKPYYNILLKDSKAYPFIKLTVKEEFPRLLLSRKPLSDGNLYFGPYTGGTVRETIETLKKIFRLRSCNRKLPADIGKQRPCLNYHINTCMAPCSGRVSKEEYHKVVQQICDFLNGKESHLLSQLQQEMYDASESLNFEHAAIVRDKIEKLKSIGQRQKITVVGGGDKDVIAIAKSDIIANVQILTIRGGKLIGRDQMWVEGMIQDESELLGEFMKRYYVDSQLLPKEILVSLQPEDLQTISQWISQMAGHKVQIRVPQRGSGRDLVNMALKNANQSLDDYKKTASQDKQRNYAALCALAQALSMQTPPRRIEAYDISTTQGYNSVGSMAVFENGMPANHQYRHFKIKTVSGMDDYGSLNEIVLRRMKRAFSERQEGEIKGFGNLPNLILADGGIGQAHVIRSAVEACGLDIPVYGMVKDDTHRTRALISVDGEIISVSDEAFRLISLIQDEVHRIAVSYHRKLNEKKSIKSRLEDIPGIGPVRRKKLLKTFGTVSALKNASFDQLCQVDGMDRSAAKNLYDFLQEQ